MPIERVGVVGCGLMGAGIAEVCAKSGYTVIVQEVNGDLLQAGMKRITGSMDRAVSKGKLSAADRDAAQARIMGVTQLHDMHQCDLVIEAITEKLDLKRKVFAELDAVTPAHTILASNTSSLAVTEMAAATKRPDRVLGAPLHAARARHAPAGDGTHGADQR